MEYLYSEKDQDHYFVQDDVHLPHALTPLYASFQLPAQEKGTQMVFDIIKLPLDRFACRLYRGRVYKCNMPYRGDMEKRVREHQIAVKERMPIIVEYYQDKVDSVLLPTYERLKKAAKQTHSRQQALELIEEMHRFYVTAMVVHFDVLFPRANIGIMLEDMYTKLTGEQDGKVVYEWLIGTMNKSLETDRAFWNFANEIKKNPDLAALLVNTDVNQIVETLRAHPLGEALIDKMTVLLDHYGYRTSLSSEFVHESWVENPKYAWEIVQTLLQKEFDFDQEFDKLVRRREAAFASFIEKVPDSPLKEQFLTVYNIALRCWRLDEDHHFYIDAMLPAVYRPVFLNIGQVLVGLGVIDEPADIFFLTYEEVRSALVSPQNGMDIVRKNRQEYKQYVSEEGVPHLGPIPKSTEMENFITDRFFGLPKFLKENTETWIKGYGASRGVHTGVVKVVRDQDDFSKVKHGDVLVCRTTTPPWTVLFSVAGAIVTDAGGILSHAGTVAREYALPAVLGTKVATKVLRDGNRVTVNGTEGTVAIVSV